MRGHESVVLACENSVLAHECDTPLRESGMLVPENNMLLRESPMPLRESGMLVRVPGMRADESGVPMCKECRTLRCKLRKPSSQDQAIRALADFFRKIDIARAESGLLEALTH